MLAEELISNVIEKTLFAAGVKFVRAKVKFAVWPVIKNTAPFVKLHVAKPEATATLLIVSDSSDIFVSPLRFVAPELVNAVKELVPFKIFASAVWVAYVELAVEVVK